jgi:Tol biopolymer transport system component
VLGAGYATVNSRAPVELETAISLTIEPPPGTRFVYGPDPRFVISPDGQSLVFSAIDDAGLSQLWLRRLDELDAKPIPGTARAMSPFFSPDSRAIGFVVDSQLRRLDLAGGLSSNILEIPRPNLRGAYWTSNDTILLGARRSDAIGISEVPASGGEARDVTTPVSSDGDQTHRFPVLLPDGHNLLYLVRARPGSHGIFVSELGGTTRKLVVRALTSFAFVEPGWLLYGDAGRLMAVAFSATSAQVTAEPRVLAPSVAHWPGSTKTEFSASSRAIAFRRGSSAVRIDKFSPTGILRATLVPAGSIEGRFALSPTGETLAYSVVDPDTGRRGIWLGDLVRDTQRRLTRSSVNTWQPVWSPDGTRLAVNIDGETVALIGLHGAPEPEILKNTPLTTPRDWFADGQLVLDMQIAGRQTDIVIHDLRTNQSVPVASSPSDEAFGVSSPSGKGMAYVSNESGRDEVYVRSLAGATAPVQVSARGGTKPVWSPDGRAIYYLAPSGAIMVSTVRTEPTMAIGDPRILLQTDPQAYFAIAPDGDLVVQYAPDNLRHPNISVIVHWQRLLDATAPRP